MNVLRSLHCMGQFQQSGTKKHTNTNSFRHRVMGSASPVITKSVSQTFYDLKQQNRCAFIPFLCAGDPNMDITAKAVIALDEVGANVIELGVPYSDPLADGPTIQGAHKRGLDNNVKLDDVIELVANVTPKISAPIVLFTYYNPIMARTPDVFCKQIKQAGASGLLVPDIPLEETGVIRQFTQKYGLELVLLTTPTTPIDRVRQICQATEGFNYLVSVTGVTGERSKVSDEVQERLKISKEVSDIPTAVGFGISKPEHVRQIQQWGADGVIVGSALVKALNSSPEPQEGLKNMRALAEKLVEGLQ
eukprot:TRINITY_DN5075_c2_g1_i1.p1 TRINITY_DN5075_c2_g1~~TRINITY_DN5075_c2_g1_i1.p1  ORF type:complete len:305 (-),score=21.77 TRINITY_DN5075_c2_g1_i1:337-1251(-)